MTHCYMFGEGVSELYAVWKCHWKDIIFTPLPRRVFCVIHCHFGCITVISWAQVLPPVFPIYQIFLIPPVSLRLDGSTDKMWKYPPPWHEKLAYLPSYHTTCSRVLKALSSTLPYQLCSALWGWQGRLYGPTTEEEETIPWNSCGAKQEELGYQSRCEFEAPWSFHHGSYTALFRTRVSEGGDTARVIPS